MSVRKQTTMLGTLAGSAVAVLAALSLPGCATSFSGDAHFSGGPRACWDKCKEQRMEMGAFVYVGEYSTGCVCKPKRDDGARASARDGAADVAPAAAAAGAGVMMQMRAAAQARQQQLGQAP